MLQARYTVLRFLPGRLGTKLVTFLLLMLFSSCSSTAPSSGSSERLAMLYNGTAGPRDSGSDPSSAAQAVPAEEAGGAAPRTLAELIQKFLPQQPALQAARLRWEASREAIVQSAVLPEPELAYRLMAMDFSGDMAGHILSLSHMFPWFGTLSRQKDIATARSQAALEQYLAVGLATKAAIKEAWAEYVYVATAEQILLQHVELLKQLHDVINARYQSNSASQRDLLWNGMEIDRIEKERADLLRLQQPAAFRLNAALGRPGTAPLPPAADDIIEPISLDEEEILEILPTHSPQLAALEHTLAAQKAGVALSQKRFYPQFVLGLEYGLGGERRMARMDGGDRDSIGAMVGIKIPLWFKSYQAGVREAVAAQQAAEHDLTDARQVLEADLKLLLYRYNEAERRAILFGETLPDRANQILQATLAAYGAGAASFNEVLAAQRELLEFRLAHRRALADRRQNLAAIEALLGSFFRNHSTVLNSEEKS